MLNEPPRASSASDFLLGAEGRLSDVWALTACCSTTSSSEQIERLNARHPLSRRGRAVSSTPSTATPGSSSTRRPGLAADQADRSVGAMAGQRQLDADRTLELLAGRRPARRWRRVAGIEYNGDCWVLRVVGAAADHDHAADENSIFVQFELNGLARVGTSPLDLLRRSVPGYTSDERSDPTARSAARSAARF